MIKSKESLLINKSQSFHIPSFFIKFDFQKPFVMKQIKSIAPFFLIWFTITVNAQIKSTRFTIQKSATVNVADIKEDWNPVVQNIEMPAPDGKSEKQKLKTIKDSLSLVYPKKQNC